MATKISLARLPIPETMVERRIHTIRKQNVMVDNDLADLYQVETFNLNKAVQRNLLRFPADFMFQLTKKEWEGLIFQTGISKGRGGRRHAPYVFTEQGVAMLSSVLNSERAVQVNIAIMRAFVRRREITATHKDLLRKVVEMEDKYDDQFRVVFNAIKKLMQPPAISKKRRIGFAAHG